MKVPFFDPSRIYVRYAKEILEATERCLGSGRWILGPEGEALEKELSLREGPATTSGWACCASGTDALILSMRALGLKPGDEVITASHTAIPTIVAIQSVGAIPVFAEIHPKTWVLSVDSILEKITKKTRCVMPVHLYGNMVNMDQLKEALDLHDSPSIAILEDVAQAHGSKLNGRSAGSWSRFSAHSFYPSKNLGAFGDGGAIRTNDANDLRHLQILRNYGQTSRYQMSEHIGMNSRLDELQAAYLRILLRDFQKTAESKKRITRTYLEAFRNLPLVAQSVTPGCDINPHLFVLRTKDMDTRDRMMLHLEGKGVQTLIHYPTPNHLQQPWKTSLRLPETESLASSILSIPMNPWMADAEVEQVIASVVEFYR